MFGKIKREQEQQRRDITWLAEENRKLRDLFTKDRHGTMRPKVDMLAEKYEYGMGRVGSVTGNLERRIAILEKKCESK